MKRDWGKITTKGGVRISIPVTQDQYDAFNSLLWFFSRKLKEPVSASSLLHKAVIEYIASEVNLYEK